LLGLTSSSGISRDSRHKRSATGAKRAIIKKKRKFELGRQPANTKLGTKSIHLVRVRGGNIKRRALRLETGNFAWGSEAVVRKTRILDVVYNASNNELVRTKTLVKSAVVQIDATPFRQWWEAHYGEVLGKRKAAAKGAAPTAPEAPVAEAKKRSGHLQKKLAERKEQATVESAIDDQFAIGRLYAILTSRPGQSGRADGYILEGRELEFYLKKIKSKK
jgi:small subunit ribosomal protein S8e